MARIAPQEAPFPPALHTYLERSKAAGFDPLVLFTTIGRSERAWTKFSGGSMLDRRSPLGLRDRELVIDRTCARTGCEYEWGVHIWIFAEQAGLSRDEVAATLEVPLVRDRWSAPEADLLAAVDALHDRSTLSDDEFEGLKRHYNEEQIFEIIQLAAFYHQVSFIANGLALPLEDKAARFADFAKA